MSTTQGLEKPTIELPKDLIKLVYSNHAKERLVDRTTGSLILAPQYIRLTEKNTIERRINLNGEAQATAVIGYKRGIDMYLPIILSNGLVKTVYFRNAKNSFKKRDEPIKEESIKEYPVTPEEAYTEPEPERAVTQDVADVPRDLGGEKESGWKSLFGAFRRIFGKGA